MNNTSIHNEDLAQLVAIATKAPSGHNTQPWLFRLKDNAIDVVADRTRGLPVVDPHDRELTISCGAATRFLELGAREMGLNSEVIVGANATSDDTLANVKFSKGAPSSILESLLIDAMESRRTNRGPFEMETISQNTQNKCLQLAAQYDVDLIWTSDEDEQLAIAELVSKGDHLQCDDPHFRRELASWVHSHRLGSKDGMSGAAFGMPDILAPAARFAIRTFDMGENLGAANVEKIRSGTPLLATFCTPDDELNSWINCGRALADVALYLTSEGLAHSYLNQPIETDVLRTKLQNQLCTDRMPQLLLRVGRATKEVPATVRRDASSVILNPAA